MKWARLIVTDTSHDFSIIIISQIYVCTKLRCRFVNHYIFKIATSTVKSIYFDSKIFKLIINMFSVG